MAQGNTYIARKALRSTSNTSIARLTKAIGAFVFLGALQTFAYAGDITIDSGVNTSYVKQTLQSDETGEVESNNIIIKPYLATTYFSRDLLANIRAEHNHVRRSLEDEDSTSNYTNLSYSARYDIFRNLLAVNINGSQNYRSLNSQSYFVDDFLLNADNLVKTSSNRASLLFTLPVGEYFGTDASITYQKSKNENVLNNFNSDTPVFSDIENKSSFATWSLYSGRAIRPFSYKLDTSAQHSQRNILGDYNARFAEFTLSANVYKQLSLTTRASYESNEVEIVNSDDEDLDSLREFYSYGIGFTWRASQNRYLEVTYNKSKNEGGLFDEEDESNNFININTQWQFTPRTRFTGNYSRRFFGTSGSALLSHSLRNWRSSVSYSEDVNTNTQLAQIQEPGLFVCANGVTDLSQCSLPDNIDTDNLPPDQFLVPFVSNVFELNDNITLRKTLSFQTSIVRRRTTIAMSYKSSSNEDLESARNTDVNLASVNLLFQLSQRTKLRLDTSYADNEEVLSDQDYLSTVKQATISVERKLSRRFFASLGFKYLNRSGESASSIGGIAGIQGPLTERRIMAAIEYKFTNVR